MIYTALTIINITLSLVAALGLVAVAWGYRGHWTRRGSVTYHFAAGIAPLGVAYAVQRLYWDGFWTAFQWLDRPDWQAWAEWSGGTRINILPNLIVLFATYHSLRALHLLIPEDGRPHWPWPIAWLYPIKCRIWQR